METQNRILGPQRFFRVNGRIFNLSPSSLSKTGDGVSPSLPIAPLLLLTGQDFGMSEPVSRHLGPFIMKEPELRMINYYFWNFLLLVLGKLSHSLHIFC